MKMKYINYSMKQIESAGKIALNILRYLYDNFLFFFIFHFENNYKASELSLIATHSFNN